MNVYISFNENVTEEDSYNLKLLARLIEDDCDLSVNLEEGEPQIGIRDGGLAIGIAIASLALTTLQALISVLQYWESKQPEYSLSITINHRKKTQTLLMENASASEIKAIISELHAQGKITELPAKSSPDHINIKISRTR